jgi:DNA/RNA-binding protein KIN17
MQTVNPHEAIERFSRECLGDFIHLLRTSHGEKSINANRFYSAEVIRDKNHIHMTATKWPSLTEFVKHLGRHGICSVTENDEEGLCIAWRDTSTLAEKRRRDIQQDQNRGGTSVDFQEDQLLKQMERRAVSEAAARVEKAKVESIKDVSLPKSQDGPYEHPEELNTGSTQQPVMTFSLNPKMSLKSRNS